MPLACVSGYGNLTNESEFYDKETLLRHFSECLLNEIITQTPFLATFQKKLTESQLLNGCINFLSSYHPWKDHTALEEYRQWLPWKQKLL